MNYEEVTIEYPYGTKTYIVITNEDGSGKSFEKDPENPEYKLFLEALSQEQ